MTTARPFTEHTLPVTGKIVKIKQWITGREFEKTQQPLYKSMKVKPDSLGQIGGMEIEGTIIEELNNASFEAYVLEVDGQTEGLVDLILDLPEPDYSFIKTAIEEVSKKK